MTTVYFAKVMESLGIYSKSRIIGWFKFAETAIDALGNFGDECRWSYACIEEIGEGLHGPAGEILWFRFDRENHEWRMMWDEDWSEEDLLLKNCINHTIG